MNDDEIKRLLARAVGPEPPLSLNREAVFRRGRHRVRARRLAATGGVAVSVVAVVLGAVALAGLNDPGPTTVGEAGTRSPAPTTSARPSPSPSPAAPTPAPPESLAPALTEVLATAALIPPTLEVRSLTTRVPLTFRYQGFEYFADAELVDRSGRGYLAIRVRDTKGALPPAACPPDLAPSQTCVVTGSYGYDMAMLTEQGKLGEIHYVVRAVKRDGTEVSATATNTDAHKAVVTRKEPPLGFDVLTEIVALPRLTVR